MDFFVLFVLYRRINGWRRRWCTYRLSQVVHTYILNDGRLRHDYYYKFNIYFVLLLEELDFIYFFTCFLLYVILSPLISIGISHLRISSMSCFYIFSIYFLAYFLSFFDFISQLICIYLRIKSDILLFT